MKSIAKIYAERLEALLKEFPILITEVLITNKDEFLSEQQDRIHSTGLYVDNKAMQTDAGKATNSVYSKKNKKKKNKKWVDLTDTGAFMDSMKVKVTAKTIEFSANFEKGDSNIQDNFTLQAKTPQDFADKVLGLSDDDFKNIRPELLKDLKKIFIREFNYNLKT